MASGLSEVLERVAAAARRSGRDPSAVTLVAVSKGVSDEAVREVYGLGVRDFGENRADDLVARRGRLPDDIRWHFIGRLQGNKVRRVSPCVHLLHSLDRPELAGYWARQPGAPPVLLEVNVSGEAAKAGVASAGLEPLLDTALGMGLDVRGLMTMAPLADDPEAARPHFAALRTLRDRLRADHPGLTELSMGMTDDYEVAVEEGATILRVGRAIFRASPGEG